ncbi:MAG: SusD/RagB family nutrient-binding outer membrane lipoprotein [Chryseolinea sp.]
MNKIVLAVVGMLSLTQCDTDQLHKLNINPQAVNEINLNFMFTAAQLGSASGGAAGDNRYIDWRTNIGMCGYAIQQLANVNGGIAPGDKYTDNPETASAPFEFLYGDELRNIAEVLKETGDGGYDEGNKQNLRNAARVLRAFLFQRLTDYYGSIPYFDALSATNVGGTFYPGYDKQKDIYMDLLKEMHEATAGFDASLPDDGFKAGDLYYSGDIAKWKKFGYSMMLRLAMRMSTVDPGIAGPYIQEAIAGGVFTSNDDNVIVPMALAPSQWVNQNGISRAFYPGDGGQPSFLSKTLVDWLKGADASTTSDDDPRLMIISGGIATWTAAAFTPVNVNPLQQKGMPNGLDPTLLAQAEGVPAPGSVDQDATYSKINFKMLQNDESYMLMNYGEVELMLAEAAVRGLGGLSAGQAAAHYAAGVKGSMQMYTIYDPSLTVADGAVTTYLALPEKMLTGAADHDLELIGNEYWVNHFLNWWEAWSNWRRTNYPKLTPTNYPNNITNGTIPQRLRYPNAEVAGNPNFAAGSTTPNNYTTRVWFAGGPE